jgi:hypothetical protein
MTDTEPTAELIERWSAAERRLYPVVLARPDLYERYLVVVRALADDLVDLSTPAALAAASGAATGRAAAAAARVGVPPSELDLDVAAGAAFALRYREVKADAERAAAAARMEAAAAEGQRWIVLSEAAGQGPDPFAAAVSSRVELYLPTGVAIHSFVELDPDSFRERYGVEALRLDPAGGGPAGEEEPVAQLRTFDDRAAWERAVADLRRECEAGAPPDHRIE